VQVRSTHRRRSRRRRLFHCAALTCAVLGIAPVASADPESEAKDLFARAHEMRKGGDCAGAVPLFRKAWRVYPQGLGSARNIAECEEQLGHYASARRAWLYIKRALLTMKEEPKYAGWDKDAEEAAKRLQPKVATVFVDVIVSSPQGEGPANEASGVEILMNGENLGPNLVGTPLERDPGVYKVRVQAPNAEPVSTDVSLAAGDSRRLTLRIVQRPPEQPPVMVDTGGGKRTAGWVLVGVGGAALIGGFVTLAIRGGALSDLEAACGRSVSDGTPCPESRDARDAEERGKTMSTLTSILLPAGAVLAAAGVGLVIWGSNSKEPSTSGGAARTSPAAGLRVLPGPGRLDAVWRF
jgi:hypothetical protein